VRALLYLFVALIGCASAPVITVPTPVEHRARIAGRDIAWLGDTIPIMRFNMPFSYAYLRAEVEICSGLKRDGWPLFFVAPINPIWMQQGPAVAMYIEKSKIIVFALGSETIPAYVRHELLHFLIGATTRGHPEEVFGPDAPCAPLLVP
jgi:hypothetical protein